MLLCSRIYYHTLCGDQRLTLSEFTGSQHVYRSTRLPCPAFQLWAFSCHGLRRLWLAVTSCQSEHRRRLREYNFTLFVQISLHPPLPASPVTALVWVIINPGWLLALLIQWRLIPGSPSPFCSLPHRRHGRGRESRTSQGAVLVVRARNC